MELMPQDEPKPGPPPPPPPSRSLRRSRLKIFSYVLLCVVLILSLLCWIRPSQIPWRNSNSSPKRQKSNFGMTDVPFPEDLLRTVYNDSVDFINEKGVVPSFWSVMGKNSTELAALAETDPSLSAWGPCYPLANRRIDWMAEINRTIDTKKTRYNRKKSIPKSVLGGCRPGFIIIGAGKCGTSSIYHYLTEHPRVLPAFEKQIHYFKYHPSKPLSWYYSWFPTTTSFLTSGALMTGEASPGYLPYPSVARMVKNRIPHTKILVIGRDPIDRSYSSYRYNYVTPTISWLKKGRVEGIAAHESYEYYEKHLFSFEQLMKAELELLKKCFTPGGYGETETVELHSRSTWARHEFERRENLNLTRLIDLDEICYGEKVDNVSLRKQWVDLKAQFPDKHIVPRNIHLTQSLLGRSLYVFPLEWWYTQFDAQDIYFICTEELHDKTGESINQIGLHLGLPSFNYSDAVLKGAYNVGGNRGYDKATPWEAVTNVTTSKVELNEGRYPLSDELYNELLDFISPLNERLFALTGRRCSWEK